MKKWCIILVILIVFDGKGQVSSREGLKSINGTRLYVKIFGKGEPLFVVHGGPGLNHDYFLPQFESLSNDFTVILFDQRACGRSAIPSTDSLGLNFFIEDIEALRKSLGYDKINILGHSWGAIPVVRYGMDHPDCVKKMVLCNAVALNREFEGEIQAGMLKRRTRDDSIERATLMATADFKAGKPEALRQLMLLSFRPSFYDAKTISGLNIVIPENSAVARKALFTGLGKDLVQYDLYPATNKFTFPVLIMQGKTDFLPLKVAEKTQVNIPGSQLLVFEKSGHFIFVEEPAKFREALVKFARTK